MKNIVKVYGFDKWKATPLKRKYARRKKLEIRINQIENTLQFLIQINSLTKETEDRLIEIWRALRVESSKYPMYRRLHRSTDFMPDLDAVNFYRWNQYTIETYAKQLPWVIKSRDKRLKNRELKELIENE